MTIREHVPLASLTTLRVGGRARYVIDCESVEAVQSALALAREHALPYAFLGSGSNVLASDDGYEGVVLRMGIPGIHENDEGDTVLLTAGAGVAWDALVEAAASRGLWGVENLAGIPGTVGAAPIQNIGAYGRELADTVESVEVLDTDTGEIRTLTNEACEFGYRDSRFKRMPQLLVLSVSFRLFKKPAPHIEYADLRRAAEAGSDLSTPAAIGAAVRAIRSRKFPDLSVCGTAGSFFKNPVVAPEVYAALSRMYPELPGFPNATGVKIPLAFILDHVLGLRGYREGHLSLFERQPLVLVADDGATANEIDTFANGVRARVHAATGITIEREVRTFPLEKNNS